MNSPKRFTLALVAGALSVTGCAAVLVLLLGRFDGVTWRALTTTVLLGVYTLLALPGVTLLDRARGSLLAWCCVGLALLGFVWGFGLIWAEVGNVDAAWRLLTTLTVCAAAVSQVCATTSRRRETDPGFVDQMYGLSNLLAYTAAGMLTLAAWDALGAGPLFWRLIAVLAAADVLAVLLQPLLRARARVA